MEKLNIPNDGEAISFENSVPSTPNFPIIPFIIGDVIGIDVTPVASDPSTIDVIDAAAPACLLSNAASEPELTFHLKEPIVSPAFAIGKRPRS